jgi:hypothetical protein
VLLAPAPAGLEAHEEELELAAPQSTHARRGPSLPVFRDALVVVDASMFPPRRLAELTIGHEASLVGAFAPFQGGNERAGIRPLEVLSR